ncbi:MAG: hypothetical protein U9N59_16855, partial [Campylobacterota bacterium]|nr:hypothetical protein [Campylobacterota bacterium]
TEENHVIYTSGWIHIESGMAISLGQEVFMLAEKNIVSDGIFDRDWNSFPIIEIDSLEEYEIQIEKLIAIVKSRFI